MGHKPRRWSSSQLFGPHSTQFSARFPFKKGKPSCFGQTQLANRGCELDPLRAGGGLAQGELQQLPDEDRSTLRWVSGTDNVQAKLCGKRALPWP